MSDDGFTPPSRDRFREERRALRAADRRRRMIGVPIVTAGLLLVAAGVYVFMNGDSEDVPTNVSGVSIVRTTTTTTSTTTTTTSTTTTTLPPTTTAPPTTVKPKPKPKPATTLPPTTAAPVTAAPPA